MDIKTFKQAASLLPEFISIIIRGRHGIGKSQSVHQLAEHFKLPLADKRLSQLSEGDLIGLPKIDGHSTKFLPPDWLYDAMHDPYLIFLDEFDRSTNEVQQAAMELILDRSIQGKKIHENSRIYAAINGGKYGSQYNVNSIDPAIYDRFWIVDLEPSIHDWLMWAQEDNHILPEIIDFIASDKEFLESKEPPTDSNKITPSRRSWERLSKTLKLNPKLITDLKKNNSILIAICSGFIGIEATSKFKQFLENGNKITAETILNDFVLKERQITNMEIAQINYIISKIRDHGRHNIWDKEQIKNLVLFFESLKFPEIKLSIWDELTSADLISDNVRAISSKISGQITNLIK